MGVYIKDMEMPESCPCELLGIGYDLYCSFAQGIPARVKEYYECCQNNKRPSWCPLVPVPPHGRLIDADALEQEMINGIRAGNYEDGYDDYPHINNMDDCVECVRYADTIIEAEEE